MFGVDQLVDLHDVEVNWNDTVDVIDAVNDAQHATLHFQKLDVYQRSIEFLALAHDHVDGHVHCNAGRGRGPPLFKYSPISEL